MAIFVWETGGLFLLGLGVLFRGAGLLPLLGLRPRGDLFLGEGDRLPRRGGGEPRRARGDRDAARLGGGDFLRSGDFFFSGVAGALLLPLEEDEEEEEDEVELSELLFRFFGSGVIVC